MIILSTHKGQPCVNIKADLYEFRSDLGGCLKSPLKLLPNKDIIITLRDKDEGGQYTGTLEEKFRLYLDMLEQTEAYVDIEFRYFSMLLTEVGERYLHRVIVSVHDYSDTPLEDLLSLINNTAFIHDVFFYKFVYKIDKYNDLLEMSNALKSLGINYVLLSTGATSLVSRVLYKQLGSVATYIGERGFETAPNQLTDNDAKRYHLQDINNETKIGGIVGGKQVIHSRGLGFYNNYFHQNSINAVYLPFVVDDIEDFIKFVTESKYAFYGLSVTMPFKNVKCKMCNVNTSLQQGSGIINLWTPNDNKTYLTDTYAFKQVFIKLNIDDKTKIILLGTGAMAKTVIKRLPRNDIYVFGRDEKKVVLLKSEHTNVFDTANLIYEGTICLINTTPLGMNDENVLDTFPIELFHMAIDLPYQNKKTNLAVYCETKNIPIVDGIEFWNMQAQKQLEVFMDNISNKDYNSHKHASPPLLQ